MQVLVQELPELLTVRELSVLLRCHVKTIRRRIEREDIIAHKPQGSCQWRIRREEALRQLGVSNEIPPSTSSQ